MNSTRLLPDSFGLHIVWLVIGLAARGDGHLDLLTHLATVCADDAKLERLLQAATPQEMMAALSPEPPAA